MSRGLGVVQRKIDELFSGDPEAVFTIEDLCKKVYGGFDCTKAQRVAVIRAAKAIAKRHPGIDMWNGETRGSQLIFLHHDNVTSYAVARLISEAWGATWARRDQSEARQILKTDQRHIELIKPGGTWWLFVQQWIAERDNDQARLEELKPALQQLEKERQAWFATARTMFGGGAG
jgi:hypothetical protein